MSIEATIFCTLSPTKFLAKRKPRSIEASVEELRTGDRLPEESWRARVVAVVRADGSDYDEFDAWTTQLADATRGAIYTPMTDEFSYVWAPDTSIDAEARVRELLKTGDATELARWISELARADEPEPRPSALALERIRAIAVPHITRRVRAGDASWAAAILALDAEYGHDGKVEALVEAAAALPATKNRALKARAATIVEDRQLDRDITAVLPKTPAKVRPLFEAAAGGDASAKRRCERFVEEIDEARAILIKSAAAWSPDAKCVRLVTAQLEPEYLDDEHLAAIAKSGFAAGGTVAAAIHKAVAKWQRGAGARAHAVTSERIREYERYKDDPLVTQPRSRGMDVAMLRNLNDALWGESRDRPRLPEDIVAMVFDRRITDARAAYAARFPKATKRVAKAAIDDAIAYFTPDDVP